MLTRSYINHSSQPPLMIYKTVSLGRRSHSPRCPVHLGLWSTYFEAFKVFLSSTRSFIALITSPCLNACLNACLSGTLSLWRNFSGIPWCRFRWQQQHPDWWWGGANYKRISVRVDQSWKVARNSMHCYYFHLQFIDLVLEKTNSSHLFRLLCFNTRFDW